MCIGACHVVLLPVSAGPGEQVWLAQGKKAYAMFLSSLRITNRMTKVSVGLVHGRVVCLCADAWWRTDGNERVKGGMICPKYWWSVWERWKDRIVRAWRVERVERPALDQTDPTTVFLDPHDAARTRHQPRAHIPARSPTLPHSPGESYGDNSVAAVSRLEGGDISPTISHHNGHDQRCHLSV